MNRIQRLIYRLMGSPRLFASDQERETWLLARSQAARAVYLRVATDAGADDLAQAIRDSTDKYFDEAGFGQRLEAFQKGLGQKAYKDAQSLP